MRARTIVGRDADRHRVAATLEHEQAGRALAVTGAPGIGKSAVVRAALSDISRVVIGRGTPPPSPPLRPLAEIAASLVRRGAKVDDPALAMYRNGLHALVATNVPSDMETPLPLHIGEALIGLLLSAGSRAPKALIIEDLHWADPVTLDVVEYLADAAQSCNIAMVVTARDDSPAMAIVQRLSARRSMDVIALAPLDRAGVRALTADCLGTEQVPAQLLELLERAEGVPLLIEEMLTSLQARGDLVRDDAMWTYVPSEVPVPRSVLEHVRARLDGLPSEVRGFIDAAALLGRRFDRTILSTTLGLDERDARRCLDTGLTAGLLKPEPGSWRLEFTHALVRDAVLALADPVRLRPLSRQFAAALEANGDLETAATLAVGAGDDETAARMFHAAGRSAFDRGLPSLAVSLFDRAVEIEPVSERTIDHRAALTEALAMSGNADRTELEADTLVAQLHAVGADRSRVQRAKLTAAKALANAGNWERAEYLINELGPSWPSPSAASLSALIALERGRVDDAAAIARAVVSNDLDAAAVCEAAEVLGRIARGQDLGEALRWFGLARAKAELIGSALRKAHALHELATIDQLRDLSVQPLYVARDAAIAAGAPGLLSAVEFHIAALHGVRFEGPPALEAARRCLNWAQTIGARRQVAWSWNLIGQAHVAAGDRKSAREAADTAVALADGDLEVLGVALGTCRGLAALLAESRSEAFELWRESISCLRSIGQVTPLPPWYLWPLLSTVYDLENDGGTRARLETDTPQLRVAPGPDGLWHLAQAVAIARAGDATAASQAVELAERAFRQVPNFAVYRALGYRILSEAAVRDGWGSPADWLTEAAEVLSSHGFEACVNACRALGRKAGVRTRRAGRGHSTVPPELAALGLTSREVDVLRLVANGLTNAEIAEQLYLASSTVKGYVESLLAKTGHENRTQLAGLSVQYPL
ncbi:MAG: AAA family ATPase [Nocardiaceae bacterium]|nr:AAA family ATPase [Nocardiaceae bacterium]